MSDLDTQIIPPVEETDNGMPPAQEVQTEAIPPAVPADNGEILPAKREDLSRKLHGSREEALRLKSENDRLKAELDQARMTPQPSPDEDISLTERDVAVFKALAAKAGLAPREEVLAIREERHQELQQQHLDVFLAEHPEYNKPNDPQSDQLWQRLQGELADYRKPSSPAEFKQFLTRAHRSLSFNEGREVERGKALGYAQANLQEQSRMGGASHGGSSAPKNPKLDPQRQAVRDLFANC